MTDRGSQVLTLINRRPIFFATLSENGNLNDNSFHVPCIQLTVNVFSTRPRHLIDSNCLPFLSRVQLLCFSTSSDGKLIIASIYNSIRNHFFFSSASISFSLEPTQVLHLPQVSAMVLPATLDPHGRLNDTYVKVFNTNSSHPDATSIVLESGPSTLGP